MTFGRPPVIMSVTTVQIPAAINDEYLSSTAVGIQPSSVLSYMSLFTYSCHLFDILKDVLELFSGPDATDSSELRPAVEEDSLEGLIIETMKISRRLNHFSSTISTELMVTDPPPTITNPHSPLSSV